MDGAAWSRDVALSWRAAWRRLPLPEGTPIGAHAGCLTSDSELHRAQQHTEPWHPSQVPYEPAAASDSEEEEGEAGAAAGAAAAAEPAAAAAAVQLPTVLEEEGEGEQQQQQEQAQQQQQQPAAAAKRRGRRAVARVSEVFAVAKVRPLTALWKPRWQRWNPPFP